MEYKGFIARHYFAVNTSVYIGEIINASAVIAFSAESLAQLREAMKNAIDNYLDFVQPDTIFPLSKKSANS